MVGLGLGISVNSHAFFTPLSLNLAPPVQFPPEDYSITGARLSLLWGKHRDVYGIDLGVLGNITEQDFVGVGLSGLFNSTKGSTTIIGLQAAGVANVNSGKTSVYGLQLALAMNYNTAEATIAGLQVAMANVSEHSTIYGAQLGVYNRADTVYGFQIGIVNSTKNLHGIQLGLMNFNDSGPFKISPFLNVGF